MELSQKFMKSLYSSDGWKLSGDLNEVAVYALKDPVACKLFWIKFMHDIGAKHVASQKFFKKIDAQTIDLTLPVYVQVRNGRYFLINIPHVFDNLWYYGDVVNNLPANPRYTLPLSCNMVLFLYVVAIAAVWAIHFQFTRRRVKRSAGDLKKQVTGQNKSATLAVPAAQSGVRSKWKFS